MPNNRHCTQTHSTHAPTATPTRTRRRQEKVIFTYFSNGGEATVAIMLASQCNKPKEMQLMHEQLEKVVS